MRPRPAPAYLAGYPPHLQQQVLCTGEASGYGLAQVFYFIIDSI